MRLIELDQAPKNWQLIKRDCQPYLRSVDDPLMLFRGMDYKDDAGFVRKKARLDDRMPSAMGMTAHNVINDYFTERFGEPFRNSVFCVSNPNLASSFGEVYNVFPIGEFTSLWSPKVEDLNYKMPLWIRDLMKGTDEYMDKVGDLWETLDSYRYRTDDLNSAAAFGHEIMIRCKEYYAIPKAHIYPAMFKKEMK